MKCNYSDFLSTLLVSFRCPDAEHIESPRQPFEYAIPHLVFFHPPPFRRLASMTSNNANINANANAKCTHYLNIKYTLSPKNRDPRLAHQ